MKKRHLETKFLKFLIERYKDLEEEENDFDILELEEEGESPLKKPISIPIVGNGEEEEEEDDDMIIDKLLTEYRKIKKQYESKIHNKRKRRTL